MNTQSNPLAILSRAFEATPETLNKDVLKIQEDFQTSNVIARVSVPCKPFIAHRSEGVGENRESLPCLVSTLTYLVVAMVSVQPETAGEIINRVNVVASGHDCETDPTGNVVLMKDKPVTKGEALELFEWGINARGSSWSCYPRSGVPLAKRAEGATGRSRPDYALNPSIETKLLEPLKFSLLSDKPGFESFAPLKVVAQQINEMDAGGGKSLAETIANAIPEAPKGLENDSI